MKTTYIQTYVNNEQLLGSDMTSVYRDLTTQRKLDNAIKKHIKRLDGLKGVHPVLKGSYQIRYESVYN